ncbi:MAG TPA: YtxH domain-containing protein [Thermoanaerobaculaceae bacterium]|nr:YtxH domain-containing protein [Thermoanaerobaculaceae bacterium]HPS79431.1 YtxH domain-containing protein [Thermoanaerobaculaceae bacterium]
MGKITMLLTGLVVGVGGMFFLDPSKGRKRRAQVRYRAGDLSRSARKASTRTWRSLRTGSGQLVQAVNGKLRTAREAVAH